MLNLFGSAFGIGLCQSQFPQYPQSFIQQEQLMNVYRGQMYPVCHHQRTECLKCKEEKAERERIAEEKKVAYKNRCKDWMSKSREETAMTHEETKEKLIRYYQQLPPHCKSREGGILIKEAIDAIASAEKKGREEGCGEGLDKNYNGIIQSTADSEKKGWNEAIDAAVKVVEELQEELWATGEIGKIASKIEALRKG